MEVSYLWHAYTKVDYLVALTSIVKIATSDFVAPRVIKVLQTHLLHLVLFYSIFNKNVWMMSSKIDILDVSHCELNFPL